MISKKKAGKARILIVENEPVLARDLKQSLTRMGYQVSGIVPTRKEAVQWLRSVSVDLVLIDVQLKKKTSGIHASKDIQSRINVPVVFLSDVPEEKILMEIRETTSHGFLLKPYKDAELQGEIEIALSQYDRQNQMKQEELQFRMALMNTGYAVLFTDERGSVTFINPSGATLLNPEKKKVTGKMIKNLFRLFADQKALPSEEILNICLEQGRRINMNGMILKRNRDNREFEIQGEIASMILPGNQKGMMLIFRIQE